MDTPALPSSGAPLDPEEAKREARRQRARENGKKGGRPPKSPFNKEQKIREECRRRGEAMLPALLDYWLELFTGQHKDATHDHRLRASENIADRCGLPKRTEGNLPVVLPSKLVNALGWRDADGNVHPLADAEPEPEPEAAPAKPED